MLKKKKKKVIKKPVRRITRKSASKFLITKKNIVKRKIKGKRIKKLNKKNKTLFKELLYSKSVISLIIFGVIVFTVVGILIYLDHNGKVLGDKDVLEPNKIIPEYYTQTTVVSYGLKTLSLQPVGGKKVRVKQKDIRYIYEKAYKNTDVIQTNYPYKIKEELVFYKSGHPLKFKYKLGNVESFVIKKDKEGNIIFYDKQIYESTKELARIFTIPTPFIEDKVGQRSFSAVTTIIKNNLLTISVDKAWLAQAVYPVVLDPTVEINVLNLHSHPQQGDNWEVDFTTVGKADLKIIPNDQSTIDDDEFVALYCGDKEMIPQILLGDIIYYKDWQCNEVGKVIHYTLKAGHHTLRFKFGDQVAYAYNAAGWWNSSWNNRKQIVIDHDKVGIISDMSANASSGQNQIVVKDGSLFSASETVVIKDNNNEETGIISSVSSNTLTMQSNLTNSYTTSANAFVKNTTDSVDLSNFPVLVNLSSDTELAASAQDDADDIVFTSSDELTQIDHEIENFNGTTGELQAWVEVPTLSVSADTIL